MKLINVSLGLDSFGSKMAKCAIKTDHKSIKRDISMSWCVYFSFDSSVFWLWLFGWVIRLRVFLFDSQQKNEIFLRLLYFVRNYNHIPFSRLCSTCLSALTYILLATIHRREGEKKKQRKMEYLVGIQMGMRLMRETDFIDWLNWILDELGVANCQFNAWFRSKWLRPVYFI